MTDEVRIVAGRPSDALIRDRLRSWSYGGIVPRANLTNYKAREGRTVLDTLRLIRDRDPDAAQAVTNFLLLMGQGYRAEARDGEKIDQRAQEYLSALDARVGGEYGGGMDSLLDVVNLTLVTQGAMALEIEVADDLDEVVDFYPVGPQVVTAKRDKETRRLMWGLQVQRGTAGADADGFLELSPRQFRYMPLHPDVDDPYGRSPILAALTAVFFKIQVLEDLKAVVHAQGSPRIKAKIVEQVITNNLPTGATPEVRKKLVADMQSALAAQVATLNPDDWLIFPESIDVSYLGSQTGTLVDVKALSEVLDKQIISGLKQLPILLGRNEGATTTHATIQWKIHVLLIEALRRRTKRLLEWAHTTALQVAGFQARSHILFEELQTNDRVADANAFKAEVETWKMLVELGWADDNEAAQALLHHDAIGTKEIATELARRARLRYRSRRRALLRTRAIEEEQRLDLEEALRTPVSAHFTRLADDYPTDAVVKQVSGLSEIDPVEVERIVAAWFEENPGKAWSQELTDLLSEHYLAVYNTVGGLALGELGITASFELKNPAVIQHLQELGAERVTGIDSETRRQLVNQLIDGVTAGEGVEQLGRRIRTHIGDMSVARSQLISTTEVATATGIASIETYSRNGVERKGWITAGDDKVTDGCRANEDASPVAMGKAFPSGHDAPPRFPGCRCSVLPILDGYTAPKTPWTGA